MAVYAQTLGQSRPSDTNTATLYTKSQQTVAYLDRIIICNTTGSSATYRVFVDADGSTYDQTTALWYDTALAANTSANHELDGALLAEGGTVGIRSGTGSALTFTLFGEEVFG